MTDCFKVICVNYTDVRMEEFLYEKLDKKIPTRANSHELLGECMIDSGHEFGAGTAYGESSSLICIELSLFIYRTCDLNNGNDMLSQDIIIKERTHYFQSVLRVN